jgi:hypothetical protein
VPVRGKPQDDAEYLCALARCEYAVAIILNAGDERLPTLRTLWMEAARPLILRRLPKARHGNTKGGRGNEE